MIEIDSNDVARMRCFQEKELIEFFGLNLRCISRLDSAFQLQPSGLHFHPYENIRLETPVPPIMLLAHGTVGAHGSDSMIIYAAWFWGPIVKYDRALKRYQYVTPNLQKPT